MSIAPDLAEGRQAYDERRWERAYQVLRAVASSLEPADLVRLAMAAYLTGRDDEFVAVQERAHHAWLAADAPAEAAWAAFWLGFYLAERGDVGPATGWLGRASRLLDRVEGDHPLRGYLQLMGAVQRLEGGDAAGSFDAAAAAVATGERFQDADLLALAVHVQGRALLEQGRLGDGLALLDEAMVGVAADEVSPLVAGLVYCSVIGACRRFHALGRARDWTTALKEWCEAQPELVPYRGQCLVYRAEILQLHGEWGEALEEAALGGGAEGSGPGPAGSRVEAGVLGAAHYQRGEIHRLRGEHAAAESAYREASRLGREPQPGLALLRLAQGDTTAAAAGMRRILAETHDRPRRARLLPACIEIALAARDLDRAREACDELAAIAEAYGTGVLETQVAHARGAIALADGDALRALVALRRASQGWHLLGAPYEVARVAVLLARACAELGDADTAAMERDAARDALARLGAAHDLALLDGEERRGRSHGLTARELEVLRLVATGRTNRAIAEELFISERTVGRHVSNIFAKLGLASRSAATAWAYEHELV